MANIFNFMKDGVSYAYDSESKNPLSPKVIEELMNGVDNYVLNSKDKDAVQLEPIYRQETEGEVEKVLRTATIYAASHCSVYEIDITYYGSLNNVTGGSGSVNGDEIGTPENGWARGFSSEYSESWSDPEVGLFDEYDDDYFELVSFERADELELWTKETQPTETQED